MLNATLAIIDASEDHAQAIDAFSQSVARLGAYKTVVYTEKMHEGLELFVRFQGSLLLYGPLSQVQWEDFFRRTLPPNEQSWPLRMVA
jgi:hypothetical protein